MAVEKTLLTADEFFRLPEDGQRHELVRGEVRTMPPAGGEHGLIAGVLFGHIYNHVRTNRLGYVFAAETGFRIERDPDTVRAADVAFVAAGRFPEGRPPVTFPDLAPDLVVEVVSPSDTAAAVEEKVQDWLRAGVRMVWVVYPATRSVMVYRSLSEVKVLTEDAVLEGGDVLPGFTYPLREVFTF